MTKLGYEPQPPKRRRRSVSDELFSPLSPYLILFLLIAGAVALWAVIFLY